MICEVLRGLTIVSRIADKTEKFAEKTGFSCDEMPCFKDRDDEEDEEGRGCDNARCRRDRDDDDDDDVIAVKAEDIKEEKKEPAKKTVSEKAAPAKKEPVKTTRAKKTASAKKTGPAKKTAPVMEEEKKDENNN